MDHLGLIRFFDNFDGAHECRLLFLRRTVGREATESPALRFGGASQVVLDVLQTGPDSEQRRVVLFLKPGNVPARQQTKPQAQYMQLQPAAFAHVADYDAGRETAAGLSCKTEIIVGPQNCGDRVLGNLCWGFREGQNLAVVAMLEEHACEQVLEHPRIALNDYRSCQTRAFLPIG
jgi:hypothetical protein